MRSLRVLSGLLFATALVPLGVADAAPPRITDLANLNRLNGQQHARIQEFADYWGGQLTRDAEAVSKARRKLLDPLRAPGVSEVFRFAYSEAAVPSLRDIIEGDRIQGTYNAMLVAGQLGSQKSLELILAHCSSETESRSGVRLWAAKSFHIAAGLGTLPQNDLNRAVRELSRAAGHEDWWLVLQRQFEAIGAVHGAVSEEVQVDLLRTTVKRMSNGEGPSNLMRAMQPAVKTMRDRMVAMQDAASQRAYGARLGPVLCEVCDVAKSHWDPAQSNVASERDYERAIDSIEKLLSYINSVIHPSQAPPRSQLRDSWQKKDKPRFERDTTQWQNLMSRPPDRGG